jgi:hypothetical protein
MFLIRKVIAERSGTRAHDPTVSGSVSRVSSVVILGLSLVVGVR